MPGTMVWMEVHGRHAFVISMVVPSGTGYHSAATEVHTLAFFRALPEAYQDRMLGFASALHQLLGSVAHVLSCCL